MMQFRTKHIFILMTLFAVLLAFVLPILLRAPQTIHQQLCQDLGINEPDKTRAIAFSAFEDSEGNYHSYFLLHSNSDGQHVLRHTFHTPRKLWWLKTWFPIDSSSLKDLGYAAVLVDERRTFAAKPAQSDIDAFLATVKPLLKNNPVSFAK